MPPWPGAAHAFLHPDRMSLLGALHGLATTPITRARVLELGCRRGENLLALAAAWPLASFTGIEPDVENARVAAERAAAAALTNVTLVNGTLDALAAPGADALGEYDYIIAHGLLSRLVPASREALWAIVGKALAPSGVALVSFDAWPGQHMLEPLRRLMAFHVAEIPDPQARLVQARAIAHWQADRWFRVHGPARHTMLQRALAELDALSDDELAHELLAEHHPLSLEEVIAEAEPHALQWLTNARASEPRLGRASEHIRPIVSAYPDVVRQQQYLDYFFDTRFRASLFCKSAHELRRQATVEDFEPLFVAPRADVSPDDVPALSANARWMYNHIVDRPTPTAVRDVANEALTAGFSDDRVQAIVAISELFFADAIELARVPPPIATRPPDLDERPRATSYATLQAQRDALSATSLWLRDVALLDDERATLALCDGAHATDQIVEQVGPEAGDALVSLVRHGFLIGGGA